MTESEANNKETVEISWNLTDRLFTALANGHFIYVPLGLHLRERKFLAIRAFWWAIFNDTPTEGNQNFISKLVSMALFK